MGRISSRGVGMSVGRFFFLLLISGYVKVEPASQRDSTSTYDFCFLRDRALIRLP